MLYYPYKTLFARGTIVIKFFFNQQNTALNPIQSGGFFHFQSSTLALFARIFVKNFNWHVYKGKSPSSFPRFILSQSFIPGFLTTQTDPQIFHLIHSQLFSFAEQPPAFHLPDMGIYKIIRDIVG